MEFSSGGIIALASEHSFFPFTYVKPTKQNPYRYWLKNYPHTHTHTKRENMSLREASQLLENETVTMHPFIFLILVFACAFCTVSLPFFSRRLSRFLFIILPLATSHYSRCGKKVLLSITDRHIRPKCRNVLEW